MGGVPWSYFTAFEPSIDMALQRLRQRVFEAGDYHGSEKKHATADLALQNCDENGTRSILDITQVGDELDICTVCPLSPADLETFFGTAEPTHEMIENNYDFYENIERGQGIYITVYKDGAAAEYFFAGYSFD